jgi:hypothetical protein
LWAMMRRVGEAEPVLSPVAQVVQPASFDRKRTDTDFPTASLGHASE